MDGKLVHMFIANGRNNDPGLFQLSTLPQILREKQIKCLGDRAYSNGDLIVSPLLNPRDSPIINLINAEQYHNRR